MKKQIATGLTLTLLINSNAISPAVIDDKPPAALTITRIFLKNYKRKKR